MLSSYDYPGHTPHRPVAAEGRPPRVVVADDDPEMRRLVADALKKDGYDVVEEPDGGRLLVRLAARYSLRGDTEPIDLIVSDMKMPVVSGLDILKGVRDAHWGTPFVLMTAFPDNDVERRAAILGATVVQKPFPLATLRATVKTLLAA
jgi:DNA-binding response OmpR family regulator